MTLGSRSDSLDLGQLRTSKGGGTGWFDVVSGTHAYHGEVGAGGTTPTRPAVEAAASTLETTAFGSSIAHQHDGDVSDVPERRALIALLTDHAASPHSAATTKVLPSPLSTAVATPQAGRTQASPGKDDDDGATSQRQHGLNGSPPTAFTPHHSPYGDEHTESARGVTVATTGEVAPSSVYSSALLQALSLREGAALLSTSLQPSEADKSGAGTMYEDAMRTLVAKQHWITLEKARQDELARARLAQECSFKPRISPYAAALRRPAALRPERRSAAEVLRREQNLARRQREEAGRALRDCTFHPLTLRTVRQAATSHPTPRRAVDSDDVFTALYKEAQERQYFDEVLRPRVVQEVQRRVQFSAATSPAPSSAARVHAVVDRLCASCIVESDKGVTPRRASPSTEARFQPQLSAGTERLVAAKLRAGERERDPVRQLYPHDGVVGAVSNAQLREAARQAREQQARAASAEARAKERRVLRRARARSVLTAKFDALSRRVAEQHHTPYRTQASRGVAELARVTPDVLPQDEAEELLALLRDHADHLPERVDAHEFATLVLHATLRRRSTEEDDDDVLDTDPLLARPPPDTRTAPKTISPARPRSVSRVRPDPAQVQRRGARRAAELAAWHEATLHRRAVESGTCVTAEHTFRPAPARRIPYECRPDVVVPIRLTRTEQLRRSRRAGQETTTADAAAPTRRAASTTTTDAVRALFTHTPPHDDDANVAKEVRPTTPRAASAPRVEPVTATPCVGETNGTAATSPRCARSTAPTRRSSVGARRGGSVSQSWLDAIADRAAFGSDAALSQLGRELLLKQLRDYHRRHTTAR